MSDASASPSARRVPRWAPALLLAVVCALPHSLALLPGRTVFYRDLGMAPRPILEEARALPDGGLDLLPLWTSGLGEGRPLLANPGNALLAPGNLLYLVFPFETAFELFLLLHAVLAALGMRSLARWLGSSESAAFVAGAAFGLGGFVISASNLLPMLAAGAFAPWVALAGLRACERPNPARLGLLALALAAAALGGQPEPVALTAVAAAAWSLGIGRGRLLQRVGRAFFVWGLAGLWALLLAAPQVLVAGLHAGASLRGFGFTTQGLLYNSLHPLRWPAFFLPRWGGEPLERLAGGFPHEGLEDSGSPYFLSLYLGLSVLLLALAALGRRGAGETRSSRLRPALVATAIAGLVLPLGRHLPFASGLVEALPLLVPFRYPVKLALLAQLALPLLAACGLDALRGGLAGRRRALLGALAAGLVALDLLVAHCGLTPTVRKDATWPVAPLARELHALAEASGARPGEWRLYHHRLPKRWGPSLPANDRSMAELYLRNRRLLVPATGLPMGIDYAFDPSGDLLDPLAEFELARAVHARPGVPQWLALADLGVLFVLSPHPDLAVGTTGLLLPVTEVGERFGLFPGEGWLYRIEAWRPRWRLEPAGRHELRPDAQAAELVERLDPERWPPVVVLQKPATIGAGAGAELGASELQLEREDHRSLAFRTRAEAPSLLVVMDTWTAGWSAAVDGEPTELLRANTAFRAVSVPAGEHLVEMRYAPPGLRVGAGLSALGLLLLGAAAWKRRRS